MSHSNDIRYFLTQINQHYKLSLSQATIDRAAVEVRSQGLITVESFLQEHVIACLAGFLTDVPTLCKSIATYHAAISRHKGPTLPIVNLPPLQPPQQAQNHNQSLPPGLSVSKVQPPIPNPTPYTIPSTPTPTPVISNSIKQPPGLTPQSSHKVSEPLKQSSLSTPTPSTQSNSSTQQSNNNNKVIIPNQSSTSLIVKPNHTRGAIGFTSAPKPDMLYLASKYRRKTACRFCDCEIIIGLNDYTTLLSRTTQIYQLLLHHAEQLTVLRQQQPIHQQNVIFHRQPQMPFILDTVHPLPLPLPAHLHDVCDGGQLLELEQKLHATITSLLPTKDRQRLQSTLINQSDGFMDLTSLSTILSSLGNKQLLQLFETPPYHTTPLPSPEFVQGTPSGEDPTGWSTIPTCLQRMNQVCLRLLPCGCPCNGLRGELPTDCPPCAIHELTQDNKDSLCEDCLYCSESILDHGPSFISGTYQHLYTKPPRGKHADVALPLQDYLIGMGLNGHFVDYSKTSKPTSTTTTITPFEMDNHHPSNFLTTKGNNNNNNATPSDMSDFFYQAAGGQQLVAKQTWSHSNLPPALSFLNESTTCKHSHHLLCFLQRLRQNWGQGNRVSFTYLRCPMCMLHIFHPLLIPFLIEHYILEQFVTAKAVQRLEYEGHIKHPAVISEHSEFYNNPVGFALKEYVFYLCSTCQKPYFGGAADCQMENNDSSSVKLVCLSCNPTPGKTCEHSEDYMVHKCKFCCSHSSYICWSNTWFCNDCHDPSRWPKLVYSRSGKNKLDIAQYYQCPSIARQIAQLEASPEYIGSKSTQMEQLQRLRCDPKECPLKVAHPPNGFNFIIGCKQCESEGLTEGIQFESSDDEDDKNNQPEKIVLQGVKQKRVKARRIKGPRTRRIAPPPSPYIVPFFEMESKIFHQLSLYSYMYLYRILYDKHFLLPQSDTFVSYLTYTQTGLSKTSPLIKELLQLSGLDTIQFHDVLPLTTIRDDNFNSSMPTSNGQLGGVVPSLHHTPSGTNIRHRPQFQQITPVPTLDDFNTLKRISFSFIPTNALDHNGLLYFLGTLAHSQPYLNPHKRGLIECLSTVDQADYATLPPWGFIERNDVRHVSEDNQTTNASYTVDLKLLRLAPTHYTLKHYTTLDGGCIRSWILEGYSNGSWYPLDIRDHDYSINGRNSAALFTCNQIAINSNTNNTINQKKFYNQFRIRRTGTNSRDQWYLACSGFELYGDVELPTIQELLTPALKHYTESAKRFVEKVPRTRLPDNMNGCTATILIPNCLRFVLDHGVRFLHLIEPYNTTIQALYEEEAFRYNNEHNNDKTKDKNKRHFSAQNTNFLPLQLPRTNNSSNQALILTRNFSHNPFHNNRYDIVFMISYNEPLLLSIVSTLNSIMSTPVPSTTTIDAKTYQNNIQSRASWLQQFQGSILPNLQFIQSHYNLDQQTFQQRFKTDITAHLTSAVEQAKFAALELKHQEQVSHENELLAERALADEQEAQRQRRIMKEEEQRVAALHQQHLQQSLQQQQLYLSQPTPEGQQQHSQQIVQQNKEQLAKEAFALAEKEKLEKEKLEKVRKEQEELQLKKQKEIDAQNERAKQASIELQRKNKEREIAEQKKLELEQKKQQQLQQQQQQLIVTEDNKMIERGLRTSRSNPLPIHHTINMDTYSTYLSQLTQNPQIPYTLQSGGILYYLGTLNHTDIINLDEIISTVDNDAMNNVGKNNSTLTDLSLGPKFKFTNPQQLGAMMLTSSLYPYQRNALFQIVDSIATVKADQHNPQRWIQIDCNRDIILDQPLRYKNTTTPKLVDHLNQAWVQFDFGAYRVHLEGYSINFAGLPPQTLMTDWVIEGSNGYTQPTMNDILDPTAPSLGSNNFWKWDQLCRHNGDKNHHYSSSLPYNVNFNQLAELSDSAITINTDKLNGLKSTDAASILKCSYRYLRLRSLHPNTSLFLTNIEFFGTIFSTITTPLEPHLKTRPGDSIVVNPPQQIMIPPNGGKSQYDLINNKRKLVYCDLANREYLRLHAFNSLFYKSGLFRHTFHHVNGGIPNGVGYGFATTAQFLQQYGLQTLMSQYCVQHLKYLNDEYDLYCALLLPLSFTTLFDQFACDPSHDKFSCYSMGLPGLCVQTLPPQNQAPLNPSEPVLPRFIFELLNFEAIQHYQRFKAPEQPMLEYNVSVGSIVTQLQMIFAYFNRQLKAYSSVFGTSPNKLRENDIRALLDENLPSDTFNTPIPTGNDLTRFNTSVYASSTNAMPFLTFNNQNNIRQVIESEPVLDFNQSPNKTQFTIPSILTTGIPNDMNNLIWSSSDRDVNPWIMIDMGPYQRVQLTGYTLSVFGSKNDTSIVYPRNFQIFGSINGKTWYIISAHADDPSLSPQTPTASWSAPAQTIGATPDVAKGVVTIPVQDTMTSYGVPLYFPAYRFFCFISNGVNSGKVNNQLMLSKIDLTGQLISSSASLSTLPFPYDPALYKSCVPPTPL